MDTSAHPAISGIALIRDFQAAFITTATVQAAQAEADQTESKVINYLQAASSGTFLQPTHLPADSGDRLTRASLDAYVKKVQVQQMQAMSAQQLQQLTEQDQAMYKGHKIRVEVLDISKTPVESLWLDKQAGYRRGLVKRRTIHGYIEQVLLDQNALLIRPSRLNSLINPALKYYTVYIIDPALFSPIVRLTLG